MSETNIFLDRGWWNLDVSFSVETHALVGAYACAISGCILRQLPIRAPTEGDHERTPKLFDRQPVTKAS